jgi:hypothetical protein
MKHLHRLIVTSSAWRRASTGTESKGPENRRLWRMNSGRMEAEALRDSLWHVAGELDPASVAYPLATAAAETDRHRSLYFECFPEPNGASQFAEQFDAPNPNECYRRTETIVPQQALALTNSKLSRDCSRALAQRMAAEFPPAPDRDEADFITAAYEQVLVRRPTGAELVACREFLAQQSSAAKEPGHARASLIHVLFNHNDFVTIR